MQPLKLEEPELHEEEDAFWSEKFDHVFHIINAQGPLQALAAKHEADLQRNEGDFVATSAPYVKGIVEESLGDRVVKVALKLRKGTYLKLNSKNQLTPVLHMTFGLVLSKHRYKETLERGPEANTAAATKFRLFWGTKLSQLRRFSDGSMAEGISWPGKSEHEKRLICSHIVKEGLKRHTAIEKKSIFYVGNLWDNVLKFQNVKLPSHFPDSSSHEEHFSLIVGLYDALSRDIRKIADLPLAIAAVRSLSPILRATEVFPPIPAFFTMSASHSVEQVYVQSIPVQVVMEGSAKWPNDRQAIARLKTAFQLRLADHLKGLEYYVNVPDVKEVHVWKNGYCFAIEVVYLGELALARKVVLPDGRLKLEDTPSFLTLQSKLDLQPKLAAALDGVRGQDESFGPACRVAKRWLASQLLHPYIAGEAVELVMAHIYLHSVHHPVPVSPDVAFMRFLAFLAAFDWKTAPLVVDFKRNMSAGEIKALRADFQTNRAKFPVMTILTHFDGGSYWTRLNPTGIVLKRLTVLTKVALKAAEEGRMAAGEFDPKSIFRPPATDDWDCLIHLKSQKLPRRHEALDSPNQGQKGATNQKTLSHVDCSHATPDNKPKSNILLDFDPVNQYLTLLRENYGDYAYFFCDPHGGRVVSVVWKTGQFKSLSMTSEADVPGRMVENADTAAGLRKRSPLKLCPNITAMVEDFTILGRDLVVNVEIHPEKWKI